MKVMIAALSLVVAPTLALAQQTAPAPGKWTLEVHGGGALSQSRGGVRPIGSFPAGEPFVAENGRPSRAVPSWFFGDGAVLFNQVIAQFGASFNLRLQEITSLDSVLTTAGTTRPGGASLGVRVTRRLSSRFGVEVSFDTAAGPLTLTAGATQKIEAVRAGFVSAFSGLLTTVPQSGLKVTATAQLPNPQGRETSLAGALTVSLFTRPRLATYAIAGLAGVFKGHSALDVELRGNYQFSLFGTFPIDESDLVAIHLTDGSGAAAILGGGLTYDVSARQGLSFDVRWNVSGSRLKTTIDAVPGVKMLSPVTALPSNTSPSLVFSTTTGIRSSLSGVPVTGLTTFTGAGRVTRPRVTAGYFVRF